MTKPYAMTITEPDKVLAASRRWVEQVVVGLNLCPFAGRELVAERIQFLCCDRSEPEGVLQQLAEQLRALQLDSEVETVLLVLPKGFQNFEEYLDLLAIAEELLDLQGFSDEFQLASFHPDYCFADATEGDPANYSNRSPYPMLHILREASVSKAVDGHPDIHSIPEANIANLQQLGLSHMQTLLKQCYPPNN